MPLFITLLLFVALPCQAETIYGGAVVESVTSVYDADTFRVDIAGWPGIIGRRVPVRVLGIDAAEIRGRCPQEKRLARQAKQFTVKMLRNGHVIELHNMRRGKYFRILADVYVDGKSLAGSLLDNHLARRYDGGRRAGWCSAIISTTGENKDENN